MWYNKNDYEDQRMTIRIHDDVENNYVEHIKMSCEITVKGPYLNYSRCYLYIGNTQKVKVCDKKGTLKCKVNGITIKKKVTVHKNVYTQPSAKIKDMLLDRIYYHVVKTYFSGNKLKVKIMVGEKIIWKMCWYLYKENLHKRYRYGIYTLKM